jgi:hypothetical protein
MVISILKVTYILAELMHFAIMDMYKKGYV